MKFFYSFKKSLSDLVSVCNFHDYNYSFGYDSMNDPYMKIYMHKSRGIIGAVVFDAIPTGFTCFVSIDPKDSVTYVCVYKEPLPF